ncbi:MAG: TIGR00266 family protein [Pseudomonadota bacterium]
MSRSHEVDYAIVGEGTQMLVVELDPGETVIAEAGVMNFMQEGIEFESKLGDGADPDQGFFGRMFSAGVRMVTGESLFMTHFTHLGHGKAQIGFAAPYPGSIVPVDLSEAGGELVCQKDSFLCAALGTRVSITFSRKLGAGLFGGEGFVLQKLEGDGLAFLHAGGTVMRRELRGETLRVDTGCLVGFSPGIDYSIERAGGLKSMLFGGEGLFLTTLSGTGTVWLQSLPFSRLADRILAFAPTAGGQEQGEQ